MKHLGTERLETNRLILRKFTTEDTDLVFKNWANSKVVTKYLTWEAHKSIKVTKEILESWINNYEKDDFYQWAICLKDNNEPIGSISVVDKDDKIKKVHIGYCIGEKWWGQGITTEAFRKVIEYLFEEVKVNRIEPRHDPKNPASGKVMINCGLKYEGRLKENDWNNQGIVDSSYYGILIKEYMENKNILI